MLLALARRYADDRRIRELHADAGGYALRLAPRRQGWPWVMAENAASFAELLADGDLDRFRVCANPECRFAYYDETKNRSRRWCAQTICGNRSKGRAFRARRRAAREKTTTRTSDDV
jgi:predicted RNA-binding Zn ribbon-like protein